MSQSGRSTGTKVFQGDSAGFGLWNMLQGDEMVSEMSQEVVFRLSEGASQPEMEQ